VTKPGLPTKTRVPSHKPSSLPRVDRNKARVFPGVVVDTVTGTRARLSFSFLSVAREGKRLARCVTFAASGSGALRRWGHRLHTANMVSVCLCVRHRHSRIAASAAVGGWARCHGLLYTQCGCVMQFGAKRCAQWARRGCTRHDGRAKPAWAARTGHAGAPHNVRRSRVPTSKYKSAAWVMLSCCKI
jgi:hypothetical protein